MKLLFILLLGLGFSQTELETRVYDISITNNQTLDIHSLTGHELDYYIFGLLSVQTPIDEQGFLSFDSGESHNHDLYYSIAWGMYSNHPSYSPEQIFVSNNLLMLTSYDTFNAKIKITAEFPEEDTGYIEEGFEFCVSPGANLLSFPCDNPISVGASLPSGIENFIEAIIGEGVATSYSPALGWIGNLEEFDPGSGYWFKSNESLCFEYDCVED